jgi:hypothetical protein
MGASDMKRAVLAAFVLLLWVSARAEERPFVLRVDKLCGVDNFHAPNTLQPCQAQSASNVLFDEDASAKMREGYVTMLDLGTGASVPGLWPYRAADGTDWLYARSGSVLAGYDGTSTSTVLSGLDATARMDCAPCLGSLYCTDRSTTVFSVSGLAVTYATAAPKASLVDCWRNRVVLGDVSGSQSTVYLSGELNGQDWTAGTKSTSPVTWRVGGVDDAGNRVKCLKAGFADFLFIGAPGSSWGLFGNDQRDFRMRSLFSDVGCLDDGTVQEHLGELTWVSNKGVERFDRNVLRYPRASEPIRGVTDNLAGSAAQEFSWTQTTQGDFQAGTNGQTTAGITAGSVVLATWTATDTSGADFGAGTLTDVSTTTTSDSITLSVANTSVSNNGFENGSGTNADNWSEASVGLTVNPAYRTSSEHGISPRSGSWMMNIYNTNLNSGMPGQPAQFFIYVLDSAENTIATLSLGGLNPATNTGAWKQISTSLASYAGRYIKLRIRVPELGDASNYGQITSDLFYCSGGTFSFYYSYYHNSSVGEFVWLDDLSGGKSTITSGQFVSRAFDTAFTTAAWLASSYTAAANGHNVEVRTQSSLDGSFWGSSQTWTSGSAPASNWNRYIRYQVNFTAASGGTALPAFNDATFNARASTGTFISQEKNFGTMTRFGRFEANHTLNGGTLNYFVRTATSSAMLGSASWVAQTPFTTITAATNPWGQYKADFACRPPPTSAVFRDRWHLFYTTSPADGAVNDTAAPLDRNLAFTFFNGIGAASAAVYRNSLVAGASASNGKIYRLYSGYNDDGAAISAHVKLKDFDGGDEDAEKVFEKLFVTLGHETEAAQNVDVDVSYTMDGDDESFSLGAVNLGEAVGRIVARVPFQIGGSNLNIGRWVSPKLSWSSLDAPVSVYGLRIYGSAMEVE